jgi:hypothetical protein
VERNSDIPFSRKLGVITNVSLNTLSEMSNSLKTGNRGVIKHTHTHTHTDAFTRKA